MRGPNPDSFQRALSKFKASLDPKLRSQFSHCSLSELHDAIQDIQHNQAKDGKQRDIRRIQAFIEAMDQFGKVIEVFLNANEMLCFIWGPVKFLLMVTSTYITGFDKLLDAYSEIGNALPGLQQYSASFESYPPLATVLEDYYSDILNFHRIALSVFARPKWKLVFKAAWKTFETDFGPITTSLTSRRTLLESEKSSASLHEISNMRDKINTVYCEQLKQAKLYSDERHRLNMREIKVKLQSPDYQTSQDISTEDRGGSQAGKWIFKHPKFELWYDSTAIGNMILYVNGIPGAGKTTLMSTVVERLLREKGSPGGKRSVAYFYFKHVQKLAHNSFLRALLEQLIDQNPALSSKTVDDLSKIEGGDLRRTAKLQELIEQAFGTCPVSFLVLDGLDECPKDEAEKTIQWMLSNINHDSRGTSLRVIFSGQRDGVLDTLLKPYPSISLDASETPAHNEDIKRYCVEFCGRIQEEFDLPQEMQHEILSKVLDGTKGMFLYARVVLKNLIGQATLLDLKKEIQPDTFPRGLEDAYARVVCRVLEKPSKERTLQLLGLVVTAQRSLRWREIQAFFCIDPKQGEVDYDNLHLRKTSKKLCGALVDVHRAAGVNLTSEDIIHIVHPTAKSYLIEKEIVNLSLEQAKLSTFCSQYLTSGPFKAGLSNEQVIFNAVPGYYAFLDYAVQNWYDHAGSFIGSSSKLEISTANQAFNSLQAFFEAYVKKKPLQDYHDGQSSTRVVDLYNSLARDGRVRNQQLGIELRTTLIRQQIEQIYRDDLDLKQRVVFGLYEPSLVLKCHKPWCSFFTGNFETVEQQQVHIDRHERSFHCTVEDCFTASLGFDSISALEKHQSTWHPIDTNEVRFVVRKGTRQYKSLPDAVRSGDIKAVESMLNSQEPGKGDLHYSLFHASRLGYLKICKLLLDLGADPNFRPEWYTSIEKAVFHGRLELVDMLLTHSRVIIRPQTANSAFQLACHQHHLSIAKLLYEAMGCSEENKPGILASCIQDNDVTLLKYLLDKGFADVIHGSYITRTFVPGSDILEMLLATGRPNFRYDDVYDTIKQGCVKQAKMILSYQHFRLIAGETYALVELARMSNMQELIPLIEKVEVAGASTTEEV
ncbi:hypothetical protein ACHAPJ_001717 [Fusarium lateritium]